MRYRAPPALAWKCCHLGLVPHFYVTTHQWWVIHSAGPTRSCISDRIIYSCISDPNGVMYEDGGPNGTLYIFNEITMWRVGMRQTSCGKLSEYVHCTHYNTYTYVRCGFREKFSLDASRTTCNVLCWWVHCHVSRQMVFTRDCSSYTYESRFFIPVFCFPSLKHYRKLQRVTIPRRGQ